MVQKNESLKYRVIAVIIYDNDDEEDDEFLYSSLTPISDSYLEQSSKVKTSVNANR